MASITLAVDEGLKEGIDCFSWVNWSEIAAETAAEALAEKEAFERFKELAAKSKLTEKDAEALAEKVKASMHSRLKKEGLV